MANAWVVGFVNLELLNGWAICDPPKLPMVLIVVVDGTASLIIWYPS